MSTGAAGATGNTDASHTAGGGKSDRLTHIDSTGDARMVDVTEKPV